ncbi:MAG TPA: biotin--[acetyl-CoA-carboxylase] ligase [Solirubrobacteraceae bacterium]|jgi:BirA family biotin operon repressor/biotin-[acetyl-CoA-carboxylase] ligase|nr:biotin--[acetyl-CoA-carboxylase] ligase [Solirubrobacteraceae bacterium]
MLGTPRRHFRRTDSTNQRLRELAERGAPHGTLVTAEAQTAGRGRHGRIWTAPPNRALLLSLLLRDPPHLLSLAAGVAVAEVCGPETKLKWPNDVLIDGRKVAGILVEGRPQHHWAILGIGLNVALRPDDFPPELQHTAGTLAQPMEAIEPILARLLDRLSAWTVAEDQAVLDAVRQRDALRGQPVSWTGGRGTAAGIDQQGRLIVATDAGHLTLDSGEVHLVA